eukprot:5009436-Pleurochrysis_carterae.AAC.2
MMYLRRVPCTGYKKVCETQRKELYEKWQNFVFAARERVLNGAWVVAWECSSPYMRPQSSWMEGVGALGIIGEAVVHRQAACTGRQVDDVPAPPLASPFANSNSSACPRRVLFSPPFSRLSPSSKRPLPRRSLSNLATHPHRISPPRPLSHLTSTPSCLSPLPCPIFDAALHRRRHICHGPRVRDPLRPRTDRIGPVLRYLPTHARAPKKGSHVERLGHQPPCTPMGFSLASLADGE